ncbi:hypothetical protein WOLCODRAFT_142611 [Wolfiporia cocos MD-104 SS10]|uniref:Uncharacterized protein n=1 Tax=Wolfiporia cocos (strain MD-104) TaxID=742152 RepID=A0A2H3J8J5_WOLCO|nr:hypothetical protein WOLCODRAFT_142611 [Wolfiporia cocos MD-104 SS10]
MSSSPAEAAFVTETQQYCYAQTLVQYLSVMLLDIATAVFSSLRVYAITGRKWQFAVVTLALGIPSAGAEIYYASTVTDVDDGRVGDILICSYNFAGTGISNYFRASLTSSVCAVTSDLIVVLATWMYTTGWRNHLKQSGVQASLIATLLMDGTMYFLIFLALNVVMLVLDFAPFLQSLDGAGNGYSTAFRIV